MHRLACIAGAAYGASLMVRAYVSVLYGTSWAEALSIAAQSAIFACFVTVVIAMIVRTAMQQARTDSGNFIQNVLEDVARHAREEMTKADAGRMEGRDLLKLTANSMEAVVVAQRDTRDQMLTALDTMNGELMVIDGSLGLLVSRTTGRADLVEKEQAAKEAAERQHQEEQTWPTEGSIADVRVALDAKLLQVKAMPPPFDIMRAAHPNNRALEENA